MGTFERIRQLSPWALGVFAFTFIAFMIIGDWAQNSGQGITPEEQEIAVIDGKPVYYSEYEGRVKEATETQKRSYPDQEPDRNAMLAVAWSQLIDFNVIKNSANELGYYISKEEPYVSILKEEVLENPPAGVKQSFIDSTGKFNEQQYQTLMKYYDRQIQQQAMQIRDNPDIPDAQKQQILENLNQQFIQTTQQLLNLEQITIQNSLSFGLQNAVNASGGIVSSEYARRKYLMDNTTADVNFISFTQASIPDEEVEVTDEDLRAYYNTNQQYYKQNESAQIQYAVFQVKPSSDDISKNDRNIQELSNRISNSTSDSLKKTIFLSQSPTVVDYTLINDLDPDAARFVKDAAIGEIVGPVRQPNGTFFYMVEDKRQGANEVVKASHILVNFNEDKDSALVEAKKIKAEVNAQNFASIARTKSMDRGSATNGGDLGYFPRGQMVEPFSNAAFAAKEGSIVGPIESQFGYHIIYVEDKTSDEIKYSYKSFEPKVTRKTKAMTAANATSFKQQIQEGEPFDSLAIKLGAMVETTPDFNRQRKILGRQSITNAAFENEVGYISDAIYVEGQGYLVFKVLDKKADGLASFDDVKEQIRPNVVKAKKMKMLMEKAEGIYSQLKDKSVISDVASIDPSLSISSASDVTLTGNIPGAGRDFALVGAVMASEVGDIKGPIYGADAIYIIQVTDKYVPSEEQISENLGEYTKGLINREKSSTYYQWLTDTKNKAKILDYRSRNYRDF